MHVITRKRLNVPHADQVGKCTVLDIGGKKVAHNCGAAVG